MHSSKLTRREVLQAGAATAAGLMIGNETDVFGQDSKTASVIQSGYVDAHSHIWTRDVDRFPLANKKTVEDLDPPSFTVSELMQQAGPVGVTKVVLIQHHTYHGWDNSYLTHAATEHPLRFRVVGMVDDTSADPAAQMRKLLKKRVTGFRITPWIRGDEKWLDGEGMAAMWKCAADTRQNICCLIDAKNLEFVDAMCKKNPDTPVVIDHFARIGVDGQVRDKDVDKLCALAKHKHTTLKISAYYALGKKKEPYHDLAPMIRKVLDAYGPERCMWASDSPYQVVGGHSYKASFDLINSGLDFLSKSDRQWLLKKTAEKVYYFDS